MITLNSNTTTTTIENPTPEISAAVSRILSYQAQDTRFTGENGWDGRVSMMNKAKGSFPTGFLIPVVKKIQQLGYEVETFAANLPKPLGPAPRDCKVDDFKDDPAYDYQYETVEEFLRRGRMIAQIATGGGKSKVCKTAYKAVGRTTLFISTRTMLLDQIADQVTVDLKERVGTLQRPSEGFNVASVQGIASALKENTVQDLMLGMHTRRVTADEKQINALTAKLKKDKVPIREIAEQVGALRRLLETSQPKLASYEPAAKKKYKEQTAKRMQMLRFLDTIEMVVAEEAHESSSDQYYLVMNNLRNAQYRLALTATPFMSDNEEANMRLMATCGQIGIQITEKQLIDSSILATPKFKIHSGFYTGRRIPKSSGWQEAYSKGIVKNESRNWVILNEIAAAQAYGLSTLVLVRRDEHGKILEKMVQSELPMSKVAFISGKSTKGRRAAVLETLKHGSVVIGSDILSTGVDVPAVNVVILAAAGKAEIGLRQMIGRGLRAKRHGPNLCFLIEFLDDFNVHLYNHSIKRHNIIRSTPGFGENFVGRFGYSKYYKLN